MNENELKLYINGTLADVESNEDLNLRIDNQMYDPSTIVTTTSEYSYSFSLPMTDRNNAIFDHANLLSKRNKFNKNYTCDVISAGINIFTGTLRLKSIENGKYNCNLVAIKQYNFGDIFGDHTMSELKWLVPFEGPQTINSVNKDMTTKYYFPFVSYGCFQKEPEASYEDVDVYTSKYDIDKTMLAYVETFPPSLNLNELVKRLFAQWGYTADGDIFTDNIANSIYLSEYLKEDQDPIYNVGGPLGKCTVNYNVKTSNKISTFAYEHLDGVDNALNWKYQPEGGGYYNFDNVIVYDILNIPNQDNGKWGSVSADNKWMFRNNCIVIPATGLYKITFSANVALQNTGRGYVVGEYDGSEGDIKEAQMYVNSIYSVLTPVEMQVVRNNDECELIHGYDGTMMTAYPHEKGPETLRPGHSVGGETVVSEKGYWYVPNQYNTFQFDPYVSENFVCGVSSIGCCPAFMKNYSSWATADGLVTTSFQCEGYNKVYGNLNGVGGYDSVEQSDYHQQPGIGANSNAFIKQSETSYRGNVSGVFYFEKNDIVTIKAVLKKYMDSPNYLSDTPDPNNWYGFSANGILTIEALSPNETYCQNKGASTWYLPTQFDTDLNLGNFLNEEEKITDFLSNYVKEFNLSVTQEGRILHFNRQGMDLKANRVPVELDGKTDLDAITIEPIEYPKTMRVEYSIDTEEAGFYYSIPDEYKASDDWDEHADEGSEKVVMNPYDETAEDATETLSNSYTWYMPFNYIEYDGGGNRTGSKQIMLPCISKDEYMIDGYKYEESMAADGKSLKQRNWFRNYPTEMYVTDKLYNEKIYLSIPTNTSNGFELSYNNQSGTLLTRYFNIISMPESDMVTVEAYLNPDEYSRIRNGAPIRVNNDLYIVTEISGYDPSGYNMTEIKAIKRI